MTETKKELGQHWLHDQRILREIAEAAQLQTSDFVLEIGPGLGTLTEELLHQAGKVTALEFDHSLISQLNARFFKQQNVHIVEGDIRTFDFSTLPAGYKIVANIPYYLTSHLIRSISETVNMPKTAVLLIQKEVAERLCAKPGQMSILAVTAQYYFDCTLGIEVPAVYFTPPPKVDSQVVILQSKPRKALAQNEEKEFFRLVKAGFSEKRKTLRNSLSGGLRISKESAETLLRSAGVDPGLRAQALSLDVWYQLYQQYKELPEISSKSS